MFDHDDIWRGIDALAHKFNYSASGLAKQAGLDPCAFNPSKRSDKYGKPRWLSTGTLSKILSVTETTPQEFFDLVDQTKPFEHDKI